MRLAFRVAAAGFLLVGLVSFGVTAGEPPPPPQTGFETSGGAEWTTHADEVRFLAEVDARSERVVVEQVGKTLQSRPMHLVRIGHPRPRTLEESRAGFVQLTMCTQHGNEPAGREACLQWIRDLAFTDDPTLVDQMRDQTILFIPTANPDGRDANSRENANGTDVNRDHLNVVSPEAQAIGRVVRDWRPAFAIDHHEYGPSEPVLYDDDVLYLWPRNLNVLPAIRELGKRFTQEHLRPCLSDAGYSSDEYGLAAVGPVDLEQTAGDHDEGIARNTAGLRHAVGILAESAVSPKLTSPIEAIDAAANMNRRVDSHMKTMECTLEFSRAEGAAMRAASLASRSSGLAAPDDQVYFDGQDEDTTVTGNRDEPTTVAAAPCAYRLSAAASKEVAAALTIHGISSEASGQGTLVRLAQEARPVIPLLLDGRATRHSVAGESMSACPAAAAPAKRVLPNVPRVLSGKQLPASGVSTAMVPGVVLLAGAVAGLAARRRS